MGGHVRVVGMDLIKPGKYQPRKDFPQSSIQSLADRIKETNYCQPLIVRLDSADDRYELIGGERRWRACQMLGWHEMDVLDRSDLTEQQVMLLSGMDNIERENVNIIEEAGFFSTLCGEGGFTHQEAADATGKSRVYVSNALRLLGLESEIQKLLIDGALDGGHARALLMAKSSLHRLRLAQHAVKKGLSVRALESLCKNPENITGKKTVQKDPEMRRLESRLADFLGNKVTITCDTESGRGHLTVAFNSLDEFDGIVEKWGFTG